MRRFPVLFLATIFFILLFHCRPVLHRKQSDHTRAETPRAVFMDDQVYNLNVMVDTTMARYIEISKYDGGLVTGRLREITEEAIHICPGVELVKKAEQLVKVKKIVVVPKDEIILLKAW